MIPGRGVWAKVKHLEILAGNLELLEENGTTVDEETIREAQTYRMQGCTIIYIVVGGSFAGFLALADGVRAESEEMIREIQEAGIAPVLLTGDHENAAETIAKQLHIREVHANCLPEDKLKWIGQYQEKGEPVCMIGDGINDAPALKKATVGIAMGGVGSDIAVDAADIVLVDDEVKELPLSLIHI